ncbi:branched-chain amino acid ABC transporter permease [Deinococcus planocerae]|uniref:branched-chain amino acid ABC transporter permease n=1 Tax=Deinococcus planocerae TaxID=1737569 RepID=UPI000C7F47DE|nr:branched-chain amino acid ABC transporter permease [Deinococcus planocerae]
MTAAGPALSRRARPLPDRTVLLVLTFLATSALLLLSHNGPLLERLGALGAVLRNPIVEAVVVSLFLANVLFAYLWRAAPWAKALVGLGSLLLVLPWAGQEDTSLLDLSIQIMIFAALALGLNIVVGLAGLLDLGYVAFFAVGAYVWGIFASPRFAEILRYYGENPGGTNELTLALGLFLTAITAASMIYIRRRTVRPTRASSWSFGLASFGLIAGLILTGRALLVLNAGAAAGLATGIHPSFFWLFLALSVLAAAVVGVLIGLPVLRLKGDYLAIITLGLGEVIRVLANNLDLYSAGSQGITPIRSASVPWFDRLAGALGFQPDQYYLLFLYVLVLILIAVILLVNVRLDRSRIGRAWIAIRDDEVAAQAMGVPLVQTKLIAFATGASFAGVMGMIFAAKQTFVSPESFNIFQSIGVLSMVILGGMGSFPGVILGAAVVTLLNLRILPGLGEATANVPWIPQQVNPGQLQRLVFGIILVTIMLLRPEGLLPSRRRVLELHHDDNQEDDSAQGAGPALTAGGGDVFSPGYATRKEDESAGTTGRGKP